MAYKVLVLNGSPHPHGCTATALDEVIKTLNEEGIETELIQVGGQDIRGCIACGNCRKNGRCVFFDLVNETAEKLACADGMVVGSPVYYASPNGTLLSVLDRLFYRTGKVDKRMKVGASVVVARRGGCTAAMDVLNKYFTISQMPVVSSRYWNMVHGSKAEDVLQDEEGVACMKMLGKNMAYLLKCMEAGREKGLALPEQEPGVRTDFIR